jgi:endonuclease/exonuclease/phosphatase (EEP) superfamily protein YafD
MNEVKFTTTISRSLYLKVYFFLYFRTRWWILLILYVCLGLLTAMGWAKARAENTLPTAFFTILFLTPVIPLLAWIQGNRRYSLNKRLQGLLHFSLSKETLNVKGDTFDNTTLTTNISRIRETKNTFLLVLDGAQTQIVPKTGLSDEQIRAVRDILTFLPVPHKLYS